MFIYCFFNSFICFWNLLKQDKFTNLNTLTSNFSLTISTKSCWYTSSKYLLIGITLFCSLLYSFIMLSFHIVNQVSLLLLNLTTVIGTIHFLLFTNNDLSNSNSLVNVDALGINISAIVPFLLSRYFSFGLI